MTPSALRLTGPAALAALLVLAGCGGPSGAAAPDPLRTVAPLPDSAVGKVLAERAVHPYSARFHTERPPGADSSPVQRIEGTVNLGARTTGEFTVSSVEPDRYKEAQEVLLPTGAWVREVDGNGRTVRGWWHDPLAKAPPGNQIMQVHAVAQLLARQPANARQRLRADAGGPPLYRLSGWIPTAALEGVDPRTYATLVPREDVPGTKGVTCTAWVDAQGRVTRFEEDLVYPDDSRYQSVMTFTGFAGPVPVRAPATGT
ncbi:hypothetical protein ABZ883_07980 [Streptomyces sp. NPDC046977]|uniref:hypothetical protein n=1 Tax=Streptomyces sp. NPDC046977 TaxID=3154703 RepID=UPI0033C282AB